MKTLRGHSWGGGAYWVSMNGKDRRGWPPEGGEKSTWGACPAVSPAGACHETQDSYDPRGQLERAES